MKQRLWSPCSSIFTALVFKLFYKSHSSVTWTERAGRVWAASLSHNTLWCLCTPLQKRKQKGEMVMRQLKVFLPKNISWDGWDGDQDSFVLGDPTMSISLGCCKDWTETASNQRLKRTTWCVAFIFRAWTKSFWGYSNTASLFSIRNLGRLYKLHKNFKLNMNVNKTGDLFQQSSSKR